MADGHGGYRRPANPAAVSGPGALSRRTDGKQPVLDIPAENYGDGQEMRSLQSAAPLPQAQNIQPQPNIVGLGEPTTRPTTPVTDGASLGPGQGTSALGVVDPNTADAEYLRRYLPVLMKQAEGDSVPPGTKQFVRTLLASLRR